MMIKISVRLFCINESEFTFFVDVKQMPSLTGLDALVPIVIRLGVSRTLAVSKPRTTATATTTFARFCDDAAFGA